MWIGSTGDTGGAVQGTKSAVLVVYFSDSTVVSTRYPEDADFTSVSTGDPGGAVLVTEPDGGAAPVRAQGGNLCEAYRQPQAARRARRAHVSGHPRQAQREPHCLPCRMHVLCGFFITICWM